MKRTLIVMGISIASLSFAVYTQTTHAKIKSKDVLVKNQVPLKKY